MVKIGTLQVTPLTVLWIQEPREMKWTQLPRKKQKMFDLIFKVSTAVLLKFKVLCYMTLFLWIIVLRRLEETQPLFLQFQAVKAEFF